MGDAVAVGLLLVHWRLGLMASTAAVLMAATRMYVGAHHPVDVVTGLEVGARVAFVLARFGGSVMAQLLERLIAPGSARS